MTAKGFIQTFVKWRKDAEMNNGITDDFNYKVTNSVQMIEKGYLSNEFEVKGYRKIL